MKSLVEFLYPAPAPRTAKAIVGWWERRRLPYNLAVGTAGAVTMVVGTLITWLPPGSMAPALPPWQGILAFGLAANVCYLLGPTAEVLIQKIGGREVLPTGPGLFRIGLTFSVGLALFPLLIVLIDWVFRIVFAVF